MDNYHHHARSTKYGREFMAKSVLDGRLSLREAAAECRLSRQSAAKWVKRYREQGAAGLRDRTSRPHCSPRRTPKERVVEIERLRRALDWSADRPAAWAQPRYRQPGAAAAGTEPHPRSGTCPRSGAV